MDRQVSRFNNVTFERKGTKLMIVIEMDESLVDVQESKSGKARVVSAYRRNITFDGTRYFLTGSVSYPLDNASGEVEL